MKLSECKHGIIVIDYRKGLIGMVVGITQNPTEEAVPSIQWQNGETKPHHHAYLKLYEE